MKHTPESVAVGFVQFYLGLENYLYFSATTLCWYDYFLTLDREIKFIWKAEQSLATILFYFYRYPGLLNFIIELLGRMSWHNWQTDARCGAVLHTQMALDLMILISSSIFAALRVYAIFNRDRFLFSLVLISGLINPIISIYIFVMSSTELDAVKQFQGCMLDIIGNQHRYELLMMIARAASVVSDGIVLILTCVKTLERNKSQNSTGSRKETLRGILFKDTAICFGLLCIVNVIGIATGRLTEFIEIWTMWTAILTSVLLSRLTLDLREVHAAEVDSYELFSRTLRELSFASPARGEGSRELDSDVLELSYVSKIGASEVDTEA